MAPGPKSIGGRMAPGLLRRRRMRTSNRQSDGDERGSRDNQRGETGTRAGSRDRAYGAALHILEFFEMREITRNNEP